MNTKVDIVILIAKRRYTDRAIFEYFYLFVFVIGKSRNM